MTTRRAQMIGHTQGCSVEIDWNGSRVFAGAIDAGGARENLIALCEWQCDTSVIGSIPMRIRCISGSLTFVNVYVNHFMSIKQAEMSPAAYFAAYTPKDDIEFETDIRHLSDLQLQEKYSMDALLLRDYISWKIEIPAENNMCQPYCGVNNNMDLVPCDGKRNVIIDGTPMSRIDTDKNTGAWHWYLYSGQTLTCDFQVGEPLLDDPATPLVT